MVYLSITGLLLDFAGVILLGVDLVRVQRRLRGDAEERVARLDVILEEIGGIDGWAKTVPTDFREWQWDEGRTVMLPGTFDPAQARESFENVLGVVSSVGAHVLTLANMQLAAIDADRSTASLSLRYSYIGLVLVIFGFGLQIAAYV